MSRLPVSLGQHHAPHVTLPLRFIFSGLASLIAGVASLILRPDLLATYHYNQYIIAVTHLITLGGITTIIMGAMYQLVPVVVGTQLHSERMAQRQFILHWLGLVGMVWMFWVWNLKQVGHFGSIMGLSIGLFVYNLGRTLARTAKWDVVACAVVSALCWLSVTMLAGLYLAASKCWTFSPFATISAMHAHAHLGGVGFFLMLIVGVSYRLIPMFALSELQNPRRAKLSVMLLNAGLAGLFVTMLFSSPWKLAFALIVIFALAAYGFEIAAVLRARRRARLDWGVKYFLTAVGLLIPLCLLGAVLSWPAFPMTERAGQWENVYGLLALMGVVALAILGMLYKIVPFVVWYASYSKDVGRRKVPAFADLYSMRLQAAGYWIYLAGLAALCAGTALGHQAAVRWSSAILCAGLIVFAANMVKILMHLTPRETKSEIVYPFAGEKA